MTEILSGMVLNAKKARSLAYYGRYEESKEEFGKVVSLLESEISRIKDPKLNQEWDKLLQEMKSESRQVEEMIAMLSCQVIAPKVVPKEQRKIQPKEHKRVDRQFIVSDTEGLEDRKQAKYPFGKQPFKKYHQDDELYQKQHVEKDPLDWGPRVQRQKKQPKKIQNKSGVGQGGKKREDYEKPWAVNAKKPKDKKEDDKDKDKDKDEKKTYLKSVYPQGTGPDAELISMLQREVIDFNPGVRFQDIAELETAKSLLEEAVLMPLQMPQLFKGLKTAWKGVLMFGPPGTGKTLLAKAIASTGKTTFFNVTAASFASKWRGQSEKLVRILFEMARFYAPTTLFIDEIDSIAGGADNDANNRKVLTQMLTSMDGANCDPTLDRKVVVIGATNRPWDLDQAIRRRLEKRIYIPLPTEVGRRELLKISLRNEDMDADIDIESIVQRTQGFSGADIANLCKEAAYMPMRRKLKNAGGFRKIENLKDFQQQVNVPLKMQDFNAALVSSKPTVGSQHLQKYVKWMQEFGEMGGK